MCSVPVCWWLLLLLYVLFLLTLFYVAWWQHIVPFGSIVKDPVANILWEGTRQLRVPELMISDCHETPIPVGGSQESPAGLDGVLSVWWMLQPFCQDTKLAITSFLGRSLTTTTTITTTNYTNKYIIIKRSHQQQFITTIIARTWHWYDNGNCTTDNQLTMPMRQLFMLLLLMSPSSDEVLLSVQALSEVLKYFSSSNIFLISLAIVKYLTTME